MKVALTGATGFIGSHVLAELQERGHEVTAVAQLTEAAAIAAGAPGAVPGSADEARGRFGDYFAEVLLLDQGTFAAKARDELGWAPTHPGPIDDFRHGSYRTQLTRS